MKKQTVTKDNKISRQFKYIFKELGSRSVEGKFNGGEISSDGGAMLLSLVEKRFKIIEKFSNCFRDFRDSRYTDHSVYELLAQRIFGIILGYEDLNDFDELNRDLLFATLVGKTDPTGMDRRRNKDKGKALAGSSTLNRLELTPGDATSKNRYKKITADFGRISRLFLQYFFDIVDEIPKEITLDVDPTDDRIHGDQDGKFFHGYYGCYCYLPLYIFCGSHLLCADLLNADSQLPSCLIEQLNWLIPELRAKWPGIKIIIRGDSAFQNDDLMSWCEANEVDYVFALARNNRLESAVQEERKVVENRYKQAQKKANSVDKIASSTLYKNFTYRTRDSWSRSRRVIAKVEYNRHTTDTRFIVTSLCCKGKNEAERLYRKGYCLRGDMENRIKEMQLSLFSDRTSSGKKRANQLRLWFSSVSYVILHALRMHGLKFTRFSKAQCHTIREKFFKIGVNISVSIRRVFLQWCSSYPYKKEFQKIYQNLAPT